MIEVKNISKAYGNKKVVDKDKLLGVFKGAIALESLFYTNVKIKKDLNGL